MDEYIKNKIKNYYKNKKLTNSLVKKYRKKSQDDIISRIINNLSNRVNKYFKIYKIDRKHTHMELIGCSYDELKLHLEKQFIENMIFENYGLWEVDHIKPISLFNLNNENEILECFNYKNLQPL
jgi:hypothetical protein